MGQISTDPGRPWLVLGRGGGSGKGLKVESKDGRDESTPIVKFEAGGLSFVEGNYRPRPTE
jgi:hypothetical protein